MALKKDLQSVLCVSACVRASICVCVYREARDQPQVPRTLTFETVVFIGHFEETSWPESPRDIPVSSSPVLELQVHILLSPTFNCPEARTHVPPACMAILSDELSSQRFMLQAEMQATRYETRS